MNLANRLLNEDDGVLTFEWILLITLVVIGIVAGLAAARDAIIDELADVAQAAVALDQSYTLDGVTIMGGGGISVTLESSVFTDTAPFFDRCDRGGPAGEPPLFGS